MGRTGTGSPTPHALREYALLADSQRGALIGPRGDLAFMCAPSFHDDAVFSSLIGGEGSFTIAPADPWYVWGGYYESRSLIFRSRWITDRGVVECREALASPGDPHRAVVMRRVQAIDTPVRLAVQLNPRAGFGRSSLRGAKRTGGVWSGQTGRLKMRFVGAPDASYDPDAGLVTEIVLKRGESHDFILELSDISLPQELPVPDELWSATENMWSEVTGNCSETAAPRDTEQAFAVLRGLTQPGGGMVAAATLSLPERAEAGRNYDYRYAWIRDQCYAGIAAAMLGPNDLVGDAVSFVTARLLEDGEKLKPAYTIDGGRVPDEKPLRGLRGYPGGADKVGNWVNGQFQLDALGECLELFAAAAGTEQLTDDARRAVDIAIEAIAKTWQKPDAGIWELEDDWWAHSRLECVAGLRSISAPGLVLDAGKAASCEALADKILAEVGRTCTHPSGRWQRSPRDERVDAALLRPPLRGALPADDPRTVATFHAVHSELSRERFVYRFRQDERPLYEAEGAFLLCGFTMALAALQQGDIRGAMGWFERNRAGCGTPGLFAEEYDIQQRQLRGNLPQAFVHAVLIEAAATIGAS